MVVMRLVSIALPWNIGFGHLRLLLYTCACSNARTRLVGSVLLFLSELQVGLCGESDADLVDALAVPVSDSVVAEWVE